MIKRLLILGGTGEAAALANRVVDQFGDSLNVISSLAGRVTKPRPLPGLVRVGGFGGIEGLANYISDEKIDLLIDATHPFATVMSANARHACDQTGTPRLVLVRPSWPKLPEEKIIVVGSFEAAADAVQELGTRAFLSFGHRGLDAFASCTNLEFIVRVIEPPVTPLALPHAVLISQRPPFSLAHEKELLEKHQIDMVVSKNSGGMTLPAKITAALDTGIPIILIARPPTEAGDHTEELSEAMNWVSGLI